MKPFNTLFTLFLLSNVNARVIPVPFQDAFSIELQNQETLNTDDITAELDTDEIYASFWKPHVPYFLKPMVNSQKLQDSIKQSDLNNTVIELMKIAGKSVDKYGHPTRVIGSPGHWATIKYLVEQLKEMNDYYDVKIQKFDALAGRINSFNLTDSKTNEPFHNATAFSLSPPVDPFVGKLFEIPNLGCNDKDFESMEAFQTYQNHHGYKIALIERGHCPFGVKSQLAGKYGFHAVVIYDSEPDATENLRGTLGEPTNTTVATIGVTYEEGMLMINNIMLDQDFSLYFAMDSFVKTIRTKNVIADTQHGDPNNIVALGAHSDSVEEGPGINDDGSGTISLLNVAKQLRNFKINNKVRFAWWAAEEEGLLGSTYYANHLTKEENHKIRLFMDYDMMASPNYEYEVYNANNSDNPPGSEQLRDLYINYYKEKGLNYTLVPFDGRSDYVGFIQNGIPAGGIAAGAEKNNVFNGNVLDKCYHQLCDDLDNLSWDAFMVNTQLIAHSVATYANSLEGFPKREMTNVTTTDIEAQGFEEPQFKYRADYLVV